MNIKLKEISRGIGTIFAHVSVEQASVEKLESYALVRDHAGNMLPCRTYALDDLDGFVLLIPIISSDLTVSFYVVSSEKVLCSATLYIPAEKAKTESRKNTLLRNKVANRIRNSDAGIEDLVKIKFISAFDFPDGSDLIRAELFYGATEAKLTQADISIDVFDFDGNPLFLEDPIILTDRTDSNPDAPNYYTRKLAFGLHIPRKAGRLTLWIHSDQHILDTFVFIEPDHVRDLKERTRQAAVSAEQNIDYERWFLQEHRTPQAILDAQRKASWENPVIFSVIVPLFHTPRDFFIEMADSVLNQSYPYLELVLVNASCDNAELAQLVAKYARKDQRVHIVELAENRGITENTNAGIAAATGDYIAFFDHDDVLEPDLLFRYARAIKKNPDIGLLYCDEDKLHNGRHEFVLFKPDFNIDLLCSNNYICHMLTVKKSIIDSLEPATSEYDGAQDHHLTLRVAETGCAIHHERHVLYHWRMHEQSTAAASDAKAYTSSVGVRVVKEHFDRIGIPVEVTEGAVPNTYMVRYEIEDSPLVSIVIATKDSVALLRQCIDSILEKSTYENYEIIIAENNSTEDETFAYYEEVTKQNAHVHVARCETHGKVDVSAVYNQGAAAGNGEYIVLLNNDTKVITPDWIERLLGPCQREDVGAVGPKLLYPDGVIQHAGVMMRQMDKDFGFFEGPDNVGHSVVLYNSTNYFNFYNLAQDMSVVTGACMMTKRSIFEEIGGFDEALPTDYDDVDYCLKLRKRQLLVFYEPSAMLYHYESVSRPDHLLGSQLAKLVEANGIIMQRYPEYFADCDPYFGPFLRNSRRNLHR